LNGLKKARGVTQESLIKAIEIIMQAFGASTEVYPGGDGNRDSVLVIIQNARESFQQIMALLMEKSKTNGAERSAFTTRYIVLRECVTALMLILQSLPLLIQHMKRCFKPVKLAAP
jgi:hypothetical protein